MNKFIQLSASWCQPCKQLKPIMDQVRQSGIQVQYIDVDENREVAMQFNVRSVPTVILVDERDEEIARSVGVHNASYYIDQYNNFD